MTDRRFLAIRGELAPDDPGARIASAAVPFSMQGSQRIYYPYDWHVFRYRARTWLGTTTTLISCLVDARTRVCATADPFQLECRTSRDTWILDRYEDRDATAELARRYADHAVRQQHKALVLPRVELVESRPVYKPFWITDCNLGSDATQTMLIDGVTGEYCALRSRPDPGRNRRGSPPVGRSPSRSTASAGGDAPQLVAGPVC